MCLAMFHLSREIKAGNEITMGLCCKDIAVGFSHRCHPDGR